MGYNVVVGIFTVGVGIITGSNGVLEGDLPPTIPLKISFIVIICKQVMGEVVFDTKGFNGKTDNSGELVTAHMMVLQLDIDVVVNVRQLIIAGKSKGVSVVYDFMSSSILLAEGRLSTIQLW